MAGKVSKTKSDINLQKIGSFLIDVALAVIVVSILNLFIVTVFQLSPTGLLEGGIETSVYDRKMEIYDYISLTYVFLIGLYMFYFRKMYSPGDKLLGLKK